MKDRNLHELTNDELGELAGGESGKPAWVDGVYSVNKYGVCPSPEEIKKQIEKVIMQSQVPKKPQKPSGTGQAASDGSDAK